jgi:hypothetical protein
MKDIKIVSRIVAKENNYDADLVEDVNDFFWKEGRRCLSSMEYTSVSFKHFGTITVSKRKVDYVIRKLIGKIRNIRKSTRYKQSTTELLLEVNYEKLRKALKQRNILAKQFYENIAKRTSRIRETSSDNSEQRPSDIGCDNNTSEERIGDATGGGTTGDSEEKIDMCDMPIQ